MAENVTECIQNITKYSKSVSEKFHRHWNKQPEAISKIWKPPSKPNYEEIEFHHNPVKVNTDFKSTDVNGRHYLVLITLKM